MSSVVQIIPNNALCVDQESLAARFREFGDRLEGGEFGEVERAVIVLDLADGGTDYRCYGRPTTNMEVVGLLEWAKAQVMGVVK